jgi:hypothetical protein
MKFHIGPIPEPVTQFLDGSWIPIRELPPTKLLIYSAPIAILLLELFGQFWAPRFGVAPHAVMFPGSPGFLLLLVFTILLHELAHAVILPGFPQSSLCIVGVWPSRLAPYVHYEGSLSRTRSILSAAAPFLLLSVLPVAAGVTFGAQSRVIAAIATINAAGACADFVIIALLFYQVPRHAMVRNHGWKTYWRQRLPEQPNIALESTPGAVTPRATEVDSQ